LGDLYELIVRIVDDRLKQRGETEHALEPKGVDAPSAASRERSPDREEHLLQTLVEQVSNLVNLQRQLLESVQVGQKRTEGLLTELLNLVRQQEETPKASNGHRPVQSFEAEGRTTLRRDEAGQPETRPEARDGRTQEASPRYPVMSPPDLSDEEVPFVPSDDWLEEQNLQPVTSGLAPDGVTTPTANPSTQFEILTDQLSDYLRRLFGIEVDYLRARQTPSSPSLQGAQVLVGEGIYNGDSVTLTIFGKSHISPTDVTVFYNAVVRPLRGSVTEPVISIVFGETFEPKALKVAHALDLLVINLKDLREVSGGEI